MTKVKVVRHIPNLVITSRLKTELISWTRNAMRRIEPSVPRDTGALATNTDTNVKAGQDRITCWFYWKQPYAGVVEDAWGGRPVTLTTSGTRAPFGKIGVEEQAQGKELREAIKRALER